MAAYGFKPGKNKADVYTKTETDTEIQEAAGDLHEQIEELLTTKQDQHKSGTVSIATSDWDSASPGWTCTKSVSGIKVTDDIICSPAPASMILAGQCGVYCSAQAAGSLTFFAVEKPSSGITMNILVLGGTAS